jgi:hypothetical protein
VLGITQGCPVSPSSLFLWRLSVAFIPKSNEDFIETMAKQGSLHAFINDLPLPAMVACACGESRFGKSVIYNSTGCPFNLQKPKEWKYPECSIMKIGTINKIGEHAKPAPFCVALNLCDAGRLWCEWIMHWPNTKATDQVLAFRSNAKEFARNLHLVGFAEGKKENTAKICRPHR